MRIPNTFVVVLLFASGGLIPAAGQAAPPPPARVPPSLEKPIDGYDLSTLFQIWRFWIEGQKGPVTESLLEEPERLEGERFVGRPLLKVTWHSDFGHYMTGDLRLYCRTTGAYGYDRRTCHFRWRRAYVPLDVETYGEENALSLWMRGSFDAKRLVAHLRTAGMTPETNWWTADTAKIFAALPSPEPILKRNAVVVSLDSHDCPAFGQAVTEMEKKAIGWRVDFLGVGDDARVDPPPPHGTLVSYRFALLTPGGGMVTIEGNGPDLDKLVAPAFAAADACEAKARSAGQ